MIVVTGATGALNGATLDHLLELVPASQLVAAVREPARARHLERRGVEVRRADYADPGSLPGAFAGADQLLLVSSNQPGVDHSLLHGAAIRAAVSVGVGRILYTSHQGAAADSPFHPARTHAATEDLLAASGVPWTSLRNGFYAHSLDWLTGPWRETGTVVVPADGPVSWTARADSAEAAARVLVSEALGAGELDGPLTLTADEAPTFGEVAGIAAEVVGRPVRLEVVDREDWVAHQVATGQPEERARFTLGMYDAAAAGCFAEVDPTMGRLLGRRPRTVRDLLAHGA